ncbi:unnamed protein product [Paramecium sonneborni]|uniref:Transmembrane protein n=1 Tax=Paramecium sonneborni TaxID=65129 RepID=A0A8S1RPN3_9CILI|nr:unnamed protein product [Paramecium sonneborni]
MPLVQIQIILNFKLNQKSIKQMKFLIHQIQLISSQNLVLQIQCFYVQIIKLLISLNNIIQLNITITENGQGTEIKTLDSQTIKLSFQVPQKDGANSTMEYISEAKDNLGNLDVKQKNLLILKLILHMFMIVVLFIQQLLQKNEIILFLKKINTAFDADSFQNLFINLVFGIMLLFILLLNLQVLIVHLWLLDQENTIKILQKRQLRNYNLMMIIV